MYLSEKRDSLPLNCLYNKGKVGCGGTSLAIESNKPYVICVPFLSMIENKVNQYPNERYKDTLLAIDSKSPYKMNIRYYLKSTKIPKIIVTYDSLYKVVECIDPSQFYLLVDEYHLLFTAYSYRTNAVKTVLKYYQNFKGYTFMTATPLESEFILDELSHLPYIEEVWDNTIDAYIQAIKCKNVEAATVQLIKNFLNNTITGNAYLFVNSIDFIKSILQKMDVLNETNTRIIYSKYNRTKVRLPNSLPSDLPKKINFLTSTVFEGSDIYDENGRIIVISDPSKSNTLLDISTSIQQIAGRIRNSKYINCITHLYKTTRYIDTSYEDFKQMILQNIDDTKDVVDEYNNLSEKARLKLREFSEDTYIQKQNNKFIYDPNLAKIDLYNYKVVNGLYKCRVNLDAEYQKHGYNPKHYDSKITFEANNTRESFKDIVLQAKEMGNISITAQTKYPWLQEAIDTLGFEKLNSLHYVQKDIKNLLLQKKDCSIEVKVATKLSKIIILGTFYTPGEIKLILNKIYKELNITHVAKASEIENFYEIKLTTKRINNKPIKGIVCFTQKFKKSN